MDREGLAKVSRWCLESIFFSQKFNATQLLYYCCHHTWRMPEIQDCSVTFCESFAKVPRELRESWGWDLKGEHSHSLNLSPHSVTLSQSLSSSLPLPLPLSPSLSLSRFHSLTLAVCLSLYLSFSLSLSLSLCFSC